MRVKCRGKIGILIRARLAPDEEEIDWNDKTPYTTFSYKVTILEDSGEFAHFDGVQAEEIEVVK